MRPCEHPKWTVVGHRRYDQLTRLSYCRPTHNAGATPVIVVPNHDSMCGPGTSTSTSISTQYCQWAWTYVRSLDCIEIITNIPFQSQWKKEEEDYDTISLGSDWIADTRYLFYCLQFCQFIIYKNSWLCFTYKLESMLISPCRLRDWFSKINEDDGYW